MHNVVHLLFCNIVMIISSCNSLIYVIINVLGSKLESPCTAAGVTLALFMSITLNNEGLGRGRGRGGGGGGGERERERERKAYPIGLCKCCV